MTSERKKLRIPPKVKQAIDYLLRGEARNVTEAAELCGCSREYISRGINKQHVQMYLLERRAQALRKGSLRAAARLIQLLDGSSEHVAFKAAELVLGIEGVKPPERAAPLVNVNLGVGYVVDWRSLPPGGPDEQQLVLPPGTVGAVLTDDDPGGAAYGGRLVTVEQKKGTDDADKV